MKKSLSCKGGEKRNSEDSLVIPINRTVAEFKQFCMKESNKKQAVQHTWGAPTGDELKLNVDCSFCVRTHTWGWTFIVRDTNGHDVGAGADTIPRTYPVCEAAACLSSLQWASSWGMSKIHVKTDSQKLLQSIATNAQDLSINGYLFAKLNSSLD